MNITKRVIKSASLSIILTSSLYANELFTIQNSSLQDAIKKVAREANMTYMVDARLFQNKKAPNLKNVEGVQNVLKLLLKNTGLKAIVKNNIIIIKKRKRSNNNDNNLGTVEVVGDDRVKTVSTFGLYDNSETASSLEIPIKDIPSSIEIVNSDVMKLRGDTSVISAVEKTVGMSTSHDASVPGGRFHVRGFNGNSVTLLYNGIKVPGGSVMSARPMDSANLDRIEIIRGANSVLHGEGSIGASVNMITKKASFSEQNSELDYSYGSFNTHKFHFGTGEEIINDTLAYRFDYSKSKSGSHVNGVETNLDRVSLNLLYALNDNLRTSFDIDKSEDSTEDAYYGTPFVDGKLSEKFKGKNYNNLKDNKNKADTLWLRANLEWDSTSTWQIKNQLYYYDTLRDWRDVEQFRYISNTNQIRRAWWADIEHTQQIIGNSLKVLNKDSLFGLENKLSFGLDISKTKFERKGNGFPSSDYVNAKKPTSKHFSDVATAYKRTQQDVKLNQYAIYMEDQLSINDKLKLIGGLRYDIVDTTWEYPDKGTNAAKKHKNLTYRVGAVYDLSDFTTLYASYSTAVEPGKTFFMLKKELTDLDLTEAKQFEIGLKQSFWDEKGEFTAALYQIDKKNLFIPDPDDPTNQINAGKQTSKGIEFGIGFSPSEQFHVDANLAYVKAKFKDYKAKNGDSYDGNMPGLIPKYVLNLGLRYMPTSNLSFGTWIRHVDSIYTHDANTIKLPSYTTVDLSYNYKFNEQISLDFFVKNVTDKYYAKKAYSSTQAIVAEPRTYQFALNYKF